MSDKNKTFKEASRHSWSSVDTVDHVNAGSLQRIADALESINNYLRELTYRTKDNEKQNAKLKMKIRDLRKMLKAKP